tara:strand:- start:1053 stop:1238 length:186 start_codon:yes stop_codon:yes gene_type:complete
MTLIEQIQALIDEEEKRINLIMSDPYFDEYDRDDVGGLSTTSGMIDAYKKVLKLIAEEENE